MWIQPRDRSQEEPAHFRQQKGGGVEGVIDVSARASNIYQNSAVSTSKSQWTTVVYEVVGLLSSACQ